MLTALGLAIGIGLLLGLLGGGGSILTVPMLVYVLQVAPKTAIATSFVVVGVSSLMALIPHARRGHVCWKSAVVFGIAGMGGAFGGGRLAGHISGDWLMVLFGLVTLTTGLAMIFKKAAAEPAPGVQPLPMCPLRTPVSRLLFDGALVGGLTGLVGVGGGFLIVPALTLWVGLPMPAAIGTSLLVIVMNAVAGFSGYINHAELDLALTAVVTVGAVAGSGVGAWLSNFLSAAVLRRGFGWFVVLVAIYVLSQALTGEVWSAVSAVQLDEIIAEKRLWGGLAAAALLAWIGRRIHRLRPDADEEKRQTGSKIRVV
ncbi:sulfite exporter TauE/SafE family protein [Methylomonas sp. EFPC3]|uniref:sulfite exporter TauE/SafE family protein n=1 Tax=Methylomonas sp. EFPC3 TaxID=3021710 RepID=UPI0024178744|nr:sulfite exporter TauE/SafE family protein [Methylomonas sp. EFPC3]WFP49895.1 sulfite exporter TauE/SafE family protein [Methylomonas sp. EFPC3]